jgi:histone deacetylase complex regulatory component SIN3
MSDSEAPAAANHETFDRVNFLELRNTQLAEAIKRVESERHYMEAEILRLQREVKRLKTELDLRSSSAASATSSRTAASS